MWKSETICTKMIPDLFNLKALFKKKDWLENILFLHLNV